MKFGVRMAFLKIPPPCLVTFRGQNSRDPADGIMNPRVAQFDPCTVFGVLIARERGDHELVLVFPKVSPWRGIYSSGDPKIFQELIEFQEKGSQNLKGHRNSPREFNFG